jgi:hypothetical protein
MKRFIILSVFVFSLFNIFSFAQFKQKDVELGLGLSAGISTSESKSNSSNQSSDSHYFLLSLMPGFYIINGLSIEPEIGITAVKYYDPGFTIIGNLSYTSLLQQTNAAIFIRAGYGLSNSSSIPGINLNSRIRDEMDIGVFNAGIGLKSLIGTKAYIRTEINIRSFSWSKSRTSSYYDDSYKRSVLYLSIILGLGVIL